MKSIKIGQVNKRLDNGLIILILQKSYSEIEHKQFNASVLIPNSYVIKSRNSMMINKDTKLIKFFNLYSLYNKNLNGKISNEYFDPREKISSKWELLT